MADVLRLDSDALREVENTLNQVVVMLSSPSHVGGASTGDWALDSALGQLRSACNDFDVTAARASTTKTRQAKTINDAFTDLDRKLAGEVPHGDG